MSISWGKGAGGTVCVVKPKENKVNKGAIEARAKERIKEFAKEALEKDGGSNVQKARTRRWRRKG